MRTARICPTCPEYLNAKCSLYNGEYLSALDVHPGESIEDILVKINALIATLLPPTT